MARVAPPVIADIVRAYENDPRTKLSNSMIQTGTSTAPVAQGKWAYVDGIARALQGALGGYVQRKQNKAYQEREEGYKAALAKALGGDTPQPGQGPLPAPETPPVAAMTPPMAPQAPAAPVMPQIASQEPPQMAPQPGAGMPPGLPPPGPLAPTGATTPPVATVPPSAAFSPRPSVAKPAPAASWIDPLGGVGKPTSSFGMRKSGFHNGIDLAAPEGTPVAAPSSGVVISAGTNKRSGNFVRILHDDGTVTGYAHLSAVDVKPNQRVDGGVRIGAVGNTGNSTGPHLHWTVTKNGKKVDPRTIQFGEAPAAPVQAGEGQPPVQMETMLPEPEAVQRPQAPALPDQVASERAALGKRLIQGGNSDIFDRALKYLDDGMGENFEAAKLRSQQQFNQSQTAYEGDVSDYNASRSDARTNTYQTNREIAARNFGREDREDNQSFETAKQTREYAQQARMANFDRETAYGLARLNNDAAYKRTIAQIEATAGTNEEKAAAKKAAFFQTPQGVKLMMDYMNVEKANSSNANKLSQMLAILEKTKTGGALAVPGASTVMGALSSDISILNALSNETTLANLGGSLGVAISDGDRKFVAESSPGASKPNRANRDIIIARLNAVKRDSDFNLSRMNAYGEGREATFPKEWDMYKNSVSIRSPNYIPFDQWRASIPKYDAQGNRVN